MFFCTLIYFWLLKLITQVSTLASWTDLAYVSWFGCEAYLGSPYNKANWDDTVDDAAEHKSRIHTIAGDFEGFKCKSVMFFLINQKPTWLSLCFSSSSLSVSSLYMTFSLTLGDDNSGSPFITGIFFFLYILITAWVIMVKQTLSF